MIIEKLKYSENLTDSEKQIAQYLLDEANHIDYITSTDLAKATFTSQTTVVRLYQKIGFKSYREFMTVLAMERKDYIENNHILNTNNSLSSYEETKKVVSKIYDNTITNTNYKIDRNIMIRVCNRILNASTIDIFAIGFCESLGSLFQSGLETIGVHCTLQNCMKELYLKNIENPKDHIAIIISIDSNNQTVLDIAQACNDYHIYTVGLSNNKQGKLSQLCQDTLQFDTTTLPSFGEVDTASSFLSIQYIIIFLTALLLAKKNNYISKY